MMDTIEQYDCARGSAFSSLFFSVFNHKLADIQRRKGAKSRGADRVCQLSILKSDDNNIARMQNDVEAQIDAVAFLQRVKTELTPQAARVLDLYLLRHTYREIAAIINAESDSHLGPKAVDNALLRIRARLKALVTDKPKG